MPWSGLRCFSSQGWCWRMRIFPGTIRAINARWLIKKALRTLIYCANPFRLIKWAFYFVLGVIALGMFTLAIGSYAHAVESAPAKQTEQYLSGGQCNTGNGSGYQPVASFEACRTIFYQRFPSSSYEIVPLPDIFSPPQTTYIKIQLFTVGRGIDFGQQQAIYYNTRETVFVCPPDGKPEFTLGPKDSANGKVCEKPPVQCLTGSIKETNVITGKEFCKPLCTGLAGNIKEQVNSISYVIGSVDIQCYGQCSVVTTGVAVSSASNPHLLFGDVKFTGQNCPVQTNGQDESSGATGEFGTPDSSDATNAAQNQLQNAASSALSNTVSSATGTATLNTVTDKIVESANAQIKASSEQNAALGQVIQNTGKDIQSAIKEAQLSAHATGGGANMGQMQMANAINDGNAQMGTKLDAIKQAIEDGQGEEPGEENPTLPPGDSDIDTDPNDVYTDRNDWSSRNYNTVLQQHVTAMNGLPLFSSISTFFHVDTSGGDCPAFSIDVPDIAGHGGTLVFDTFCTADLQRIFLIIALCVKLLCLYQAFRIAILD